MCLNINEAAILPPASPVTVLPVFKILQTPGTHPMVLPTERRVGLPVDAAGRLTAHVTPYYGAVWNMDGENLAVGSLAAAAPAKPGQRPYYGQVYGGALHFYRYRRRAVREMLMWIDPAYKSDRDPRTWRPTDTATSPSVVSHGVILPCFVRSDDLVAFGDNNDVAALRSFATEAAALAAEPLPNAFTN